MTEEEGQARLDEFNKLSAWARGGEELDLAARRTIAFYVIDRIHAILAARQEAKRG
jgi:hypothetical protein